MTPAANAWDEANIPKDAMRWGVCSVVIEPRYAQSILEGIAADGLLEVVIRIKAARRRVLR